MLGQFSTAVVGLTLVQSAYTAEIIRGGFLGVDHGQYEAAAALGATRLAAHAAHYSAAGAAHHPAIRLQRDHQSGQGNGDGVRPGDAGTVHTIQMIYNRTQEVIPLLMVGAAWYLAITSVLSAIQYLVERGLARSERRSAVNSARSSRTTQPARQPQPQEAVHAQLS